MSTPEAPHDDRAALDPKDRPRASVVGYAVGTGAAVMALAAPVLHFAFPAVADWIHFGGSFLLGAAAGALAARLRTPYLGG